MTSRPGPSPALLMEAERRRVWALALFGDTPGQQWTRRRVLDGAGKPWKAGKMTQAAAALQELAR